MRKEQKTVRFFLHYAARIQQWFDLHRRDYAVHNQASSDRELHAAIIHHQRIRIREYATVGQHWSEDTINTWWRPRKFMWLGSRVPGACFYLADDARIYRAQGKLRLFWRRPVKLGKYMSLVRLEHLTLEDLSWLRHQLTHLEDRIEPVKVFARRF